MMKKNKKLYEAMNLELKRQRENVELIASENFVTEEMLICAGSVLTNKYAEGYPGKRYYGGCEYVDIVEQLAIDSAKKLFGAEHANVQPHSGSQANTAAFAAFLNPGDVILGMGLASGGHLTHGYSLNFSGKIYKAYGYDVDPTTYKLDYEAILKQAKEIKPKLIIAGASAYSQKIDFKKFREIADAVDAILMVDMAHIAGLVATGLHPDPVPYADVVTSTTHKTLRGPRSGLILCKAMHAKKIDSAVFPGNQGGPLEHIIAAKTVCFDNAQTSEYKKYMEQVVKNADIMAKTMARLGYKIISDSTENHLVLIETKNSCNLTGKACEDLLFTINITINKNSIPFDNEKPAHTSGIRIGSPAMTSRGLKEQDFILICEIIDKCLRNPENKELHVKLKKDILKLLKNFPLYPNIKY